MQPRPEGATITAPRELRSEPLSALGRHVPLTVEAGARLDAVLDAMRGARGDCALVVRDGRLVGIFTERDVLLKVLGRAVDPATAVDALMTPDPVTLEPEATIRDAIALMDQGGFRDVPLVDPDGRLQGLVRQQDILAYVAEAFPEEILNLPPRPHQRMEEPEGA
jgi:CBS domain-containing protein